MIEPSRAVATWWSYAQADATVLAVVVTALAVAALAFVTLRIMGRSRKR